MVLNLPVGAHKFAIVCWFQKTPGVLNTDDGKFMCSACGAVYEYKHTCQRHIKSIHMQPMGHICPVCKRKFSYADNLKVHLKAHMKGIQSSNT